MRGRERGEFRDSMLENERLSLLAAPDSRLAGRVGMWTWLPFFDEEGIFFCPSACVKIGRVEPHQQGGPEGVG